MPPPAKPSCTQIAAQMEGFRLLQKGQVLKKDLPDKDTVCEIRFQGSRNNGAHNITMLVHIVLSSWQFKQWCRANPCQTVTSAAFSMPTSSVT